MQCKFLKSNLPVGSERIFFLNRRFLLMKVFAWWLHFCKGPFHFKSSCSTIVFIVYSSIFSRIKVFCLNNLLLDLFLDRKSSFHWMPAFEIKFFLSIGHMSFTEVFFATKSFLFDSNQVWKGWKKPSPLPKTWWVVLTRISLSDCICSGKCIWDFHIEMDYVFGDSELDDWLLLLCFPIRSLQSISFHVLNTSLDNLGKWTDHQ